MLPLTMSIFGVYWFSSENIGIYTHTRVLKLISTLLPKHNTFNQIKRRGTFKLTRSRDANELLNKSLLGIYQTTRRYFALMS